MISESLKLDLILFGVLFFILAIYGHNFANNGELILSKGLVAIGISDAFNFLGSQKASVLGAFGIICGYLSTCILIRLSFANPWLKIILASLCVLPEIVYWWYHSLDVALITLFLVCIFFGYKRQKANLLALSAGFLLFSWQLGWFTIFCLIVLFYPFENNYLAKKVIPILGLLIIAWLFLMLLVPQKALFSSFSLETSYILLISLLELSQIYFYMPAFLLIPFAYAFYKAQWFLLILLLGPFILPLEVESLDLAILQIIIIWPLMAYLISLWLWDLILMTKELKTVAFIILIHLIIFLMFYWSKEAQILFNGYPSRSGIEAVKLKHKG